MPNLDVNSLFIIRQLNFSSQYENGVSWTAAPPLNADGTPASAPKNIDLANGAPNPLYPTAVNWRPAEPKTTNISLGSIAQRATGTAIGSLSSLGGIPQVAQVGQSITDASENYSVKQQYAVSDITQMKPIPGVKYPDFRARKYNLSGGDSNAALITARLDGTSAAIRGSVNAGIYAAAAATVGAYSVFNLDATYGWGDHDNPYAVRKDFTARSNIATRWKSENVTFKESEGKGKIYSRAKGDWLPTINPAEVALPFRGDRVTVIDFGQRSLAEAYLWRPRTNININETKDKLGLKKLYNKSNLTKDFIKFYFTGPKLHAGSTEEDDIIVFRATINSFGDTFNGGWQEQQMIGRADPNFHYTGYSRDISLDFTVYATDRDELKPIWRKLNALAGYTAPEYDAENIGLVGPWMRITVGDVLNQQAIVLTSLNYTYYDDSGPWEINIEDDPQMMQVPHKVSVSISAKVIADWLPQKGGRFFSLAKRFRVNAQPIEGNDNWLSDVKQTTPLSQEELKEIWIEENKKGEKTRDKEKSETTLKGLSIKKLLRTNE